MLNVTDLTRSGQFLRKYIVNCIPEERAWSVLHQAIYHGNITAVTKLVEDYGADVGVLTRISESAEAEAGTSALKLAGQLGEKDIFTFLLKYAVKAKKYRKGQDFSFFVSVDNGKVYTFRKNLLLRLTLASFTGTFFGNSSYSLHKYLYNHTAVVMQIIWQLKDGTWEKAKEKIHNTLCGIDQKCANDLVDEISNEKEKFFSKVIDLYTRESPVYKYLFPAFTRQSNEPYMALSKDLSIGPFAIMLNSILLHWDELIPFQGPTYRGVNTNVTSKYKENETILFYNFLSSSENRTKAENFQKSKHNPGTLFIFENGKCKNTLFRPRDIRKYSGFDEAECLYPLGAEFRVISVNKFDREVHLQLLDTAM